MLKVKIHHNRKNCKFRHELYHCLVIESMSCHEGFLCAKVMRVHGSRVRNQPTGIKCTLLVSSGGAL